MKKLKIGIAGLGRISTLHLRGYEDNDAAGIYAVCDIDEETALRVKNEVNAEKYYTDFFEMASDPKIDAIEILSPTTLHEEMAVLALSMGKHVALQKPMANSLEGADRMIKAAEKSGKVFKVTDNFLFYPPIVQARKLIDDGVIGTPHVIRMKSVSGLGGWEIPEKSWEWRLKESLEGRGPHIFDHGHHLWSTAWFLLGGIERVVAWVDSANVLMDSPATIMWKYKDESVYGTCELSHSHNLSVPSVYYANDEWIEITGSNGIIIIERCSGQIKNGPGLRLFSNDGWKEYDVKTDWYEGFKGATKNFIDSISSNEIPLLNGYDAREILKMSLAIHRSAVERREVYVDEIEKGRTKSYSEKCIKMEKKSLNKPGAFLAGGGNIRQMTYELLKRFDEHAAKGCDITIGIDVTPSKKLEGIKMNIKINNGSLTVEEGSVPGNPSILIQSAADTWSDILMNKEKLETAFLFRKIRITGRIEDALNIKKIFHF